MAVSAADVKRLRELTGAGMLDCKKALDEAAGDFDKFRALWQDAGEGVTSFVQSGSLGRVPQAIRPFIERMKRTDSPAKLAALLDKLNA